MKSEQHNRKMRTVFLSMSVIMIIVSAFILSPYLFPKNNQEVIDEKQVDDVEDIISYELKKSITKLSPILNITVLDKDGNIKSQQIKEDDLVLENFLKFFVALLWDPDYNHRHASLYDTGGTLRTFAIYDSVCGSPGWSSGCYMFNKAVTGAGGFIGIGNGTTAPTRQDYNLESQQETYIAISDPEYFGGLLSMSASWSVSSNYSVSEVVFVENWGSTANVRYDVALLRDIFTPVSVVTGDQIFASYNIWLNNTGFTNNFGLFLQSLFEDGGVGRTFVMIDVGGTTRTFYNYFDYVNTATTFHWNYYTGRVYIAVGENSSISRSNHELTDMVGSYIGVSQPTQNTSAVILSASQIMTGTYDIDVAGLFVKWADTSSGLRTVMFWALNFTSVSVYAGYTTTVSFRLLT